jgi:hypothetical protein
MILVRNKFQAKYGKGGELVALFQEVRQQQPEMTVDRILTDASGPFYTVIIETIVESLADWEQRMTKDFSNPTFEDWFARMTPLIESGRRDFYNIEG